MSKSSKDKLIQKEGDFSQSKVKQYMEREENTNNVVSRGQDIIQNQKK